MSLIGTELDKLDTPVLWVDLDLMEKNIDYLSNYFKNAGVNWRPHTKGIKIPAIAHKLLHAGAIGITCSKLGEAEVMAAAGISDILVANEVVGEPKLTRLVNLRRHADVMVVIDDLGNAEAISIAAQNYGVKIRVLVELDSGMERCGITPGPGVVEFVKKVASLPGLHFSGLMAWEGHVTKIQDPAERNNEIARSVGLLVDSARLCEKAGFSVPIVSCGGTVSYRTAAHISGVTEIQAGGGIFGDIAYRTAGAGVNCSLFILATISSHPIPERATVNAGRKAMNIEYFMPEVVDRQGIRIDKFSAEHAVLKLDPNVAKVKVGEKLNFIPGYGDLTMFLHNQLYGIRNKKVEVIWDIQGRGKLT